MNLSRRRILLGLLAAPVVCSASSLMAIRGVPLDPTVRVQTWPFGADITGPWEVYEGPQSEVPDALRTAFWGQPKLPTPDQPHRGPTSEGRADPTLPLLVIGGATKGWIAGESSGACREDLVKSKFDTTCVIARGLAVPIHERLPGGFGVNQIWSLRPQDQEIMVRVLKKNLEMGEVFLQRHLESTARLQERAAEISTWGDDLTLEDEIALGLREPEVRAA